MKTVHGMNSRGNILCSKRKDLETHSNNGFVSCKKCIKIFSEPKKDSFANISYYKGKGYGFFKDGTKGYPNKFYKTVKTCVDAAIKAGFNHAKIHPRTYVLMKFEGYDAE